tara:strand:- start:1289 stop:1435 length:147 start_codon:yes stop_codon:yes gene_type:complete
MKIQELINRLEDVASELSDTSFVNENLNEIYIEVIDIIDELKVDGNAS